MKLLLRTWEEMKVYARHGNKKVKDPGGWEVSRRVKDSECGKKKKSGRKMALRVILGVLAW